MKKQLIIFAIEEKLHPNALQYTDKDFTETSQANGTTYTTSEFQELWNKDEIKVSDYFIRFILVELKALL